MKKTVKLLAVIFAFVMSFSSLPLSAFAQEAELEVKVTAGDESSAELSLTINNPYLYEVAEVQTKNSDGSWSESETQAFDEVINVGLMPKTVSTFRVRLYYYDYNTSKTVYSKWSNEVTAYPDLTYLFDFERDAYTYASGSQAVIYWMLSKYSIKYLDGFSVYASTNGGAYKFVKNVAANGYYSTDEYSYEYKCAIKAPSANGYAVNFKVYPYFNYNSKTYLSKCDDVENAVFLSENYATVTTKKDKVIINFKKIGASKINIQYSSFNMKTKKSSAVKSVNTTAASYTIKNAAKNYSLDITVTPYWGSVEGDSLYLSSHDPMVLLKSVPRSKSKTVKVVSVRGKKAKVHWKEKLTKKDKKIIKKFFYNKYKGKNPSREEMARYAFNWIHSKVKYDYKYKMGNRSYVDAIFNKKMGQCLQYNGAMAKVLTYLGYEARIIEGTRKSSYSGTVINHFWCEVKLYGRWYLVETGNERKSPGWQHFVELYGNGMGYIKCKKPAKDK